MKTRTRLQVELVVYRIEEHEEGEQWVEVGNDADAVILDKGVIGQTDTNMVFTQSHEQAVEEQRLQDFADLIAQHGKVPRA